jgi:glycosyltransferase involved in cell wall biosynthesis
MKPGPSISVVIPAHNAAETINEQLGALRDQDVDAIESVVVVDSQSTDDTVAVVEEAARVWPKVRLVRADRPGANVARNRGVRATTSDLVLMCDADDVVDGGWVDAMSAALSEFDVVRGRYALELLNDADSIVARGSVASAVAPTSPLFGGVGGCCGFRRTAWIRLGGLYDHHYGADDAEFFWRAHEAGLRVGYAEDAVSNYRLRPGYRSLFRQQRVWAESRALLYREFGDTPYMRRRTWKQFVTTWGWIVVHVRDAFVDDPARRGTWVRSTAGAVGRIKGSVRHRVWYP